MTCIIQETRNRYFLAEDGAWTSDINEAVEFPSLRETIEHKRRLHLDEATILIFRGKEVYRLDEAATRSLSVDNGPDLLPVDDNN